MLLQAENLNRSFGGIVALADVSFTVPAGEILGMIGANGSGKTTCLNLLTRMLAPSAGKMRLDGTEYGHLPAQRLLALGITRTFQNLRLFRDLTVHENVALGVQAKPGRRRTERDIRGRVGELLDRSGIARHAGVLPSSLPYGTQRVVEITRALAAQPRLMFLDEPFAGMSSVEALDICRLLLDMQAESGMALVIVDHNIEVLSTIARRFIALARGQVIAEGDPKSVLADPAVVRSYVGQDD